MGLDTIICTERKVLHRLEGMAAYVRPFDAVSLWSDIGVLAFSVVVLDLNISLILLSAGAHVAAGLQIYSIALTIFYIAVKSWTPGSACIAIRQTSSIGVPTDNY